jgi:SAM-dependent methyltransferase
VSSRPVSDPPSSDPPSSDTPNSAQRESWDGDGGAFWAAHADRFDAEVSEYRAPFLAAAGIGETERVLDVGCGNGRITLDAARAARAGSALGVDLSAVMLDVARRRAEREQVGNVAFEQADAQVHPFGPGGFDVVVSRNGVMFFGDPVAAFANLAGALRPGGRLVLLTWQSFARNEWFSEIYRALAAGRDLAVPASGEPGPFGLCEPERVRSVLTGAGFTDLRWDGLRKQMWFGADPDDAFHFVAGHRAALLQDLDQATAERARDNLRASLAEHHTAHGVRYDSAAWLITARRG